MPDVLPTLPTLSPMFDTLLPFLSENENKVFNSSTLASNEEKSPHLLSHRGFKAFQFDASFRLKTDVAAFKKVEDFLRLKDETWTRIKGYDEITEAQEESKAKIEDLGEHSQAFHRRNTSKPHGFSINRLGFPFVRASSFRSSVGVE
ncbi:hypothetical protein Tco_0247106 [Tanacetum coccineum]